MVLPSRKARKVAWFIILGMTMFTIALFSRDAFGVVLGALVTFSSVIVE